MSAPVDTIAERPGRPVDPHGPTFTRASRLALLGPLTRERILVLDGAMGTMIQSYGLSEADFRGERFRDHPRDLRGDNDLLSLTRPDVIAAIHAAYLDAGADIIETNTFTATGDRPGRLRARGASSREMNEAAARLARAAADASEAREPGRPRYVGGALGPTNRTASISPDVERPGRPQRPLRRARGGLRGGGRGLVEGGADLLLVETIFDTLNAKAAIFAIEELFERARLPAAADDLAARSPTRAAGRSPARRPRRSGTRSATRGRSRRPQLRARGAGAAAVRPGAVAHRRRPRVAPTRTPACPNEFGGYDETPAETLGRPARARGRRPGQHRRRLLRHDPGPHPGDRGRGRAACAPRPIPAVAPRTRLVRPRAAGHPAPGNVFVNVGERTNVTGSRASRG